MIHQREERRANTIEETRREGKRENVGKKSRRRMDYRGGWKDGTYGSKNRNQSHWLKAAWPEKRESTWPAGCWRAELPGSSMSTCLPLPPPDSRLSLSFPLSHLSVSSSLRFFIFFFLLLLLLLLLSRICSSLLQGGPPRARSCVCCCYLYPWPVHQTDTRRVVSRKFARERLRRAARQCASAELVSPSKP